MKGKTESIRMKRLYGIFLTLSLLLGACIGEEGANELPQENIPISFLGDVLVTRSVKEYATTGDLQNIGVFAYFSHGNFNEGTATPNFMYNQLVAKQPDGTWSYNPVKFWPDNSTADKISFFAYAPYTDATGNSYLSFQNKETASGFPVLSYTVPEAENDQIDFLAATPILNQNNGNVSFKLRHTLTKINVYVKSNDDTAGKSVTSFSITGMKSGTLTYHAPVTDSDKGWQWTFSSPDEKETFTADITNFPVPNTIAEEKKLLATFFLLPAGKGSQFSITYRYMAKDGNDNTITQAINIENQPLPSTGTWNPGTSVSYTIGISRKTISVMSDNGPASWEGDTDSETVNGTEEKQETD